MDRSSRVKVCKGWGKTPLAHKLTGDTAEKKLPCFPRPRSLRKFLVERRSCVQC